MILLLLLLVVVVVVVVVDSITRYVLMWSIYGRFIYCARKFYNVQTSDTNWFGNM